MKGKKKLNECQVSIRKAISNICIQMTRSTNTIIYIITKMKILDKSFNFNKKKITFSNQYTYNKNYVNALIVLLIYSLKLGNGTIKWHVKNMPHMPHSSKMIKNLIKNNQNNKSH